jgi:hypothetical protein
LKIAPIAEQKSLDFARWGAAGLRAEQGRQIQFRRPEFRTKSTGGYIMIESLLAALVTPAALATAPMNEPAPETAYDWKSQKSVTLSVGDERFRQNMGTFRGTQSFVNGTLVIDDWNSD